MTSSLPVQLIDLNEFVIISRTASVKSCAVRSIQSLNWKWNMPRELILVRGNSCSLKKILILFMVNMLCFSESVVNIIH